MIKNNRPPEIKTEYKCYTIKINNKEIKLVYKITQYQLLKNQTGEYIKKLKKQNIQVKAFGFKDRNTDELQIYYYKLYSEKLFDLKYRYKRIMSVLNKINKNTKQTIIDDIIYVWESKNYHKTSKDKLKDKESTILDILGSYYLAGLEEDYILTQKKEKTIKKYEILKSNPKAEKLNRNFKKGIRIVSKEQIAKWEKENKMQTKRWKSSKTYKLNKLYSYDNHRDRHYEWDFVKERWIYCNPKYQITKSGLINSEEPYVAKWCLVDTENLFEFEGNKYKIDEKVEQYKVNEDNMAEMDKILVIKQYDNEFYFDQNIERINNKYIKRI